MNGLFKPCFRQISCPLLLLAIAGCSSTNMHYERPFIESTTVYNRPISEPVRAVTSFSDGLSCMDIMLRLEHLQPTLISSKFIEDASNGKASVSAKDMVITSLSQMSRTSNAFQVVDFEIDPLKQDTVQTLTTIMLPSGTMQIPLPELYISGSISYVDQNVMIRNTGFGISHERWEIGASNDIITTAIGLELHIGQFVTRTLFPGIDSANELVAGNKGTGLDLGGRIKKAGVQFSFGDSTSQGVGPAIRTLVDLGMIELVGKWARIPYWQCLSLDQSHPEFQRQLLDWFNAMSETDRVRFFQTGLRSLGYYEGEVDGISSPELKEAVLKFQVDSQSTPSANLNFATYDRLLKNYVITDGNGNFKRIGWKDDRQTDNYEYGIGANAGLLSMGDFSKFPETPRAGFPDFESAVSSPTTVIITLDKRQPANYSLGEALHFTVSVDRMSYVSCFYQDAGEKVTQIYPSVFQTEILLPAHRSVEVPDISDPNSFSIEMTKVGGEEVMCVASSQPMLERLEEGLGVPSLTTLEDIQNLDVLQQRLQQILGKQIRGETRIGWVVQEPF